VAVRRLIDLGWDVNQTIRNDPEGCARSALGLADRFGNQGIARMFMRAGAEVEWHMPTGYNTMIDIKNSEVQTWITDELRMCRRLRRNR
jgi:hypothetical protein